MRTGRRLISALGFMLAVFSFAGGPLVSVAGASSVCAAAPSGLTSWYPADGNANDIIGGQHGSLQNGAGFAPGEVGQAFDLNGTSQFVRVPNSPSLSFTGSFTIDAWVLLRSYSPEFAPVVSKWNDLGFVNLRSYFLAVIPSGQVRFDVSTNGGFLGAGNSRLVISAAVVPLNVLTHVAGVFDGASQTLTVYVNGAPSGTMAAPFSTVFVNAEPLLIGAGDLGSNVRDFTDGLIDEVELFHRALSAAEIQAIYATGSAGKIAPVLIDIKPSGEPNPINRKSKGKVPVAVLTTPTFDAATLDVNTIHFAGAPVAVKNNGTFMAALEDVDGDGDLDLVLHFETQALTELSASSTAATLTGQTLDGRCVSGTDSVKIVP